MSDFLKGHEPVFSASSSPTEMQPCIYSPCFQYQAKANYERSEKHERGEFY